MTSAWVILGIVGVFVDASAAKLKSLDFDRFCGNSCEYLDEVLRNVTALHRVLSSHLPASHLQVCSFRVYSASGVRKRFNCVLLFGGYRMYLVEYLHY